MVKSSGIFQPFGVQKTPGEKPGAGVLLQFGTVAVGVAALGRLGVVGGLGAAGGAVALGAGAVLVIGLAVLAEPNQQHDAADAGEGDEIPPAGMAGIVEAADRQGDAGHQEQQAVDAYQDGERLHQATEEAQHKGDDHVGGKGIPIAGTTGTAGEILPVKPRVLIGCDNLLHFDTLSFSICVL